jgi:hypothetical protein
VDPALVITSVVMMLAVFGGAFFVLTAMIDNKAIAQDALAVIHASETDAHAETGSYLPMFQLMDEGFANDRFAARNVSVTLGNDCFIAVTEADSEVLYVTSKSAQPVTVDSASDIDTDWCLGGEQRARPAVG